MGAEVRDYKQGCPVVFERRSQLCQPLDKGHQVDLDTFLEHKGRLFLGDKAMVRYNKRGVRSSSEGGSEVALPHTGPSQTILILRVFVLLLALPRLTLIKLNFE